MPSLKEFRNRIAAVKSTQKITKAMQMVAAAKLKRAQDAAMAARPYAERIAGVVANLAAAVRGDGAPRLLRGTGKDDVHVLVVATSERGLCGGFNTQIVRLVRERIATLQASGKTVKILTVGKKGRDQLRRTFGGLIIDHVDLSGIRTLDGAPARLIGDNVRARFAAGEFDIATLFYSKFRSVMSQAPQAQQIIPATAPQGARQPDLGGAAYEYEPDEAEILAAVLPRYLDSQILSALLENNAGFFAAQMTAMDNATRNAGDIIKQLSLSYNRQRQAGITKELIEIVSASEAM